jgi:hypothetical protein
MKLSDFDNNGIVERMIPQDPRDGISFLQIKKTTKDNHKYYVVSIYSLSTYSVCSQEFFNTLKSASKYFNALKKFFNIKY